MSIVREALNSYANSANKVWASDRAQTVGASDVGQCARKTFWSKNEADPTHAAPRDPDYSDSWGARMRGTIFENEFWEPALRSVYGERLLFAGKEQQTFVSGFLSATPDGLLTGLQHGEIAKGSGAEVMVECKTADPRTNLTEAKAENVFQTQVQMGLVRKITQYQPTHSILSYTDASFWSEGKEFVISFDPDVFAAAENRATMIMTATDASDLKPEGWIAGGRECDYCPFTRACGIERRRVPEQDGAVADPQFVAEMADLGRKLKWAEGARELADKQARELQIEIKDRLRTKSLRRIVGDGVSVSWSYVKGRSSYDNAAIKEAAIAAGVDIEQFKNTGEPSDRLAVTLSVKPAEIPQSATAA